MTRLVMIGDVGAAPDYHAGDEAMLEAAVCELRARGADDVTVVSAAPEDSARRYGVAAVPRIGFSEGATPGRAAREARLSEVLRAAAGQVTSLAPDDTTWAVIDAVSASDAVVIAGGGNLTTPFAEHLYERAALAGIAVACGRRLVVAASPSVRNCTRVTRSSCLEFWTAAELVGLPRSSVVRDGTQTVGTSRASRAGARRRRVPRRRGLVAASSGSEAARLHRRELPPAAPVGVELHQHLARIAALLDHAAGLDGSAGRPAAPPGRRR